MSSIDKKDIQNIEILNNILKSKKIGAIKIKKGNYEIEVSSKLQNNKQSGSFTEISKTGKEKLKTLQGNKEIINEENIVSSPMVGVVYLSSEPSQPPFVKVGQHVKQGDVLMLIEAMKTFNDIKAPKSGVIKKITTLNSQPVEFGEILVIIE